MLLDTDREGSSYASKIRKYQKATGRQKSYDRHKQGAKRMYQKDIN